LLAELRKEHEKSQSDSWEGQELPLNHNAQCRVCIYIMHIYFGQ